MQPVSQAPYSRPRPRTSHDARMVQSEYKARVKQAVSEAHSNGPKAKR